MLGLVCDFVDMFAVRSFAGLFICLARLRLIVVMIIVLGVYVILSYRFDFGLIG